MTDNSTPTTDASTDDQRDELEQLIDARIEERLAEIDTTPGVEGGSPPISRRAFLLGLAGTAVGGSVVGYVLDDDGTVVAQSADPSELGTSDNPLDTIHVNDLFQNTDILTVDDLRIEGPATEHVQSTSVSGSTGLDVSSYNEFDLDMSGATTLTIANGGHALAVQTIGVRVTGDGSSLDLSAFAWGDAGEPDDPGSGADLEFVAWTVDGGSTWRAAEVWRSA